MFKIYRNKKYKTIATYACGVIAAAILIGFLMFNIGAITDGAAYLLSVLNSVVLGVAIAYLINPIMGFYESRIFSLRKKSKSQIWKKRKAKRFFAILCTLITICVVLLLFMLMILPQIFNNMDLLERNIMQYVGIVLDLVNKYKDPEAPPVTSDKVGEWIDKIALYLGNFAISTGGQLIVGIINFMLGIIISLYVLFNKEKLLSAFKKFFRAILPKKAFSVLAEATVYSDRVFGQYIRGKLIDSTIVGIMLFIVLSIFGIPFSGIVSIFIAATNMIPYFGPFIGAVPSFLLVFVADPPKVIPFLIILLVIQQIDANFIDPKIVGDSVGLSALWVITAVSVFGGIFGIIGMFLAVPTFTVIYNYVKRAVNKRLSDRGLPTNTNYYSDMDAAEISKEESTTPSHDTKESFAAITASEAPAGMLSPGTQTENTDAEGGTDDK